MHKTPGKMGNLHPFSKMVVNFITGVGMAHRVNLCKVRDSSGPVRICSCTDLQKEIDVSVGTIEELLC